MTSFLLIISFLLHLVLFMIIFYLYQHIQTIKSDQTKEIEDLLNNFLREIKLENKNLRNPINHFEYQNDSNRYVQKKSESDEQAQISLKENENKKDIALDRLNSTSKTSITNKPDKIETSMHSQVNYLYEQNYTVEEIAKQLNCSTTEVQLLIKFNET